MNLQHKISHHAPSAAPFGPAALAYICNRRRVLRLRATPSTQRDGGVSEDRMKNQPENQFDFWLGEWDAHWGEDGKATNTITRILDDRIVQEDFVAPDLHGMSFSSYDPERKLWCQTWVDNNGTYLDFTGIFEDGKMILVRDAIVRGEQCKQRMVWYDIEEDQFHWNWERSDDGGNTWRALWQIHYTRKNPR